MSRKKILGLNLDLLRLHIGSTYCQLKILNVSLGRHGNSLFEISWYPKFNFLKINVLFFPLTWRKKII